MHIENKRLFAGLQECVDGLTALSDTAQAKTFHASASIMLTELLRRENVRQLCENYAQGQALGAKLAAAMKSTGTTSLSTGATPLSGLPATMDTGLNIEDSYGLIERLRAALTQLITDSGYPAGKGSAVDDAVLALFDWEAAVCKQPPPQQAAKKAMLDIQSLHERSTRGQGGVFCKARVTKHFALHGGFGNNTTLFEVEDDQGKTWPLVSRAKQEIPLLGLPSQDISKEFYLVSYAHKKGIRVAEPMWLEMGDHTDGLKFLVSRQVGGRNFGTAVGSEPLSDAQVKSLAQGIAAIHQLPFDANDADLKRGPLDLASAKQTVPEVVTEYLFMWYAMWQNIGAGAYPMVEATFKWLMANVPEPDDKPTFLHGDYALHNILIEGDEVSGILDWEMSHVGDRAEDISWLLSSIRKHVSPEQFMGHYLAAGGRRVSGFQLKYYEVLVLLKLMIVCLESQIRFQTLPHAEPHFCILGLTFIQHPSATLAAAIRAAEAAR